MLAVLADSPSLPRRKLKLAIEFAEHWQIPLKVIASERARTTKLCAQRREPLFSLQG
jgi:hypothetical protein